MESGPWQPMPTKGPRGQGAVSVLFFWAVVFPTALILSKVPKQEDCLKLQPLPYPCPSPHPTSFASIAIKNPSGSGQTEGRCI